MTLKTGIVIMIFIIGYGRAHADLTTIENLNEAQMALAAEIEDICPRLGNRSNPTLLETQLYWACTSFIHTANAIQGSGPDTFALNMSESQLRAVLQEMAHEEATVSGDAFTEVSQTQFSSIASRLRSLRRGGNNALARYRFNINNTLIGSDWTANVTESGNNFTNLSSPLSYYLNGNFNNGDKEETSREHAFDFSTTGLTLGADYRLGGNAFVGTAFGYSNLDLNINYLELEQGTEIGSYDLSLYGTYFVNSAYFNLMLGYGQSSIENRRSIPALAGSSLADLRLISETVSGYTDANTMSFSLNVGNDNSYKSFSLSHYGQLDMRRVYIAEYDEEGVSPLILHVNEETVDSASFILGAQLQHASSLGFGVVTEMIRFEWEHQFENESREVEAYYVYDPFEDKSVFAAPSDDPDQDYFTLGVGLTTVLPMGIQLFAYYENLINLKYYSNQSFAVGFRMENF